MVDMPVIKDAARFFDLLNTPTNMPALALRKLTFGSEYRYDGIRSVPILFRNVSTTEFLRCVFILRLVVCFRFF